MKTSASLLLIIWSSLLIEPLSANINMETKYSSCSKKQKVQSSCSRSKCSKPVEKENKKENDCANNRCNPLMSCPTGNFYFFNYQNISIQPLILLKQKVALVDDNRIAKNLTECWHPPEII